jgi:hypothetical protein
MYTSIYTLRDGWGGGQLRELLEAELALLSDDEEDDSLEDFTACEKALNANLYVHIISPNPSRSVYILICIYAARWAGGFAFISDAF